ncbi:hypothetical protein WSM22_16510 [Cytophagales bacterium WSM2-2]|nr:hypothetical protein WSM22_16510 [Cytophagales bacterium WSM2-2]
MRGLIVGLGLAGCAIGIAALFWHQELKYQLPTPVPSGYVPMPVGLTVTLPKDFTAGSAYFLHFYNPDCPCSRFNARHLKSLIRAYADSVKIVIVVPTNDDVVKARKELGEELSVWVDSNEAIAKSCGVYSTPQAAIIDKNGKLFYRGNYNASRYCTSRATNFAELSLIALLNHQPPPGFGLLATQSYGCELGSKNEIELF